MNTPRKMTEWLAGAALLAAGMADANARHFTASYE